VDIICTGNHELYHASTADLEHDRLVPGFKERYLASNLDYIDPQTGDRRPMAQRYRKFQTKNQKLNVVAFGFLFDFTGNSNNTVVQPVEETIKEEWFQAAIREEADVFVVIGHVAVRMEEFKTIFNAIRKQNWFKPIVFLGGHAHVRDATKYDSNSFALASGRYFETIGWLSIDQIKGNKDASFQRRYIDNNLLGLYHHSGLNKTTFPTEHGKNVSAMITTARHALSLDKVYGCAPQDYWMARAPFGSKGSIFTWLQNEVLPGVAQRENRTNVPRLVIENTGTIRFDIFKGPFTRDTTYIISPFTSGLSFIRDVPYEIAKKVLEILNGIGPMWNDQFNPRMMSIPEQWLQQRPAGPLLSLQSLGDVKGQKVLSGEQEGNQPKLVQGYTTTDDIGTDGDDAVHEPIPFYNVPNCFQAEVAFPESGEPQKVDLVFGDFIQPWVVPALRFSGGDYRNKDVEVYINGSFTEMMAAWIKENWANNC
jgi:hypothetical protein